MEVDDVNVELGKACDIDNWMCLVNQVKDNIAVRTAAYTAHRIIRPHQYALCLAHTCVNGVVIVIGALGQGFIKHREALPRCV